MGMRHILAFKVCLALTLSVVESVVLYWLLSRKWSVMALLPVPMDSIEGAASEVAGKLNLKSPAILVLVGAIRLKLWIVISD